MSGFLFILWFIQSFLIFAIHFYFFLLKALSFYFNCHFIARLSFLLIVSLTFYFVVIFYLSSLYSSFPFIIFFSSDVSVPENIFLSLFNVYHKGSKSAKIAYKALGGLAAAMGPTVVTASLRRLRRAYHSLPGASPYPCPCPCPCLCPISMAMSLLFPACSFLPTSTTFFNSMRFNPRAHPSLSL